jgi:transposase
MTMRDVLGVIYPNDLFADLYPQVGHYSEPPWRLALVTLMQFGENLTDRQAAEAVRGRIDWKYALGLELTDAGCDFPSRRCAGHYHRHRRDHRRDLRLVRDGNAF